MKERYLFRGKRIDNGEWVYGVYIEYANKSWILNQSQVDRSNHSYLFDYMEQVIPETVCQCTGLKDKNDALIYEGNIVKVEKGYCGNPKCPAGENIEIVKYNSRYCDYPFYRFDGDSYIYAVEIIGNIHDNPELLEV